MCLIIYKPEGVELDMGLIERAWRLNRDGFGLMVRNLDKPEAPYIHRKHNPSLDEVFDLLDRDKVKDFEMGIHFRSRTHGKINEKNTHPYEITDGWLLMHNGILTNTGATRDGEMSDTWHWIEHRLKPLIKKHPDLLVEPAFLSLIMESIGSYNRLLLLGPKGFTRINMRNEYKGLYLSNSDSTYDYSSHKKGNYGYLDDDDDYKDWWKKKGDYWKKNFVERYGSEGYSNGKKWSNTSPKSNEGADKKADKIEETKDEKSVVAKEAALVVKEKAARLAEAAILGEGGEDDPYDKDSCLLPAPYRSSSYDDWSWMDEVNVEYFSLMSYQDVLRFVKDKPEVIADFFVYDLHEQVDDIYEFYTRPTSKEERKEAMNGTSSLTEKK